MIPVFQTRMSREEAGNCFEACVASILEVPLASVPDFGAMVLARRPDWPEVVRAHEGDTGLPWPEGVDDEYERDMRVWLASYGLAQWEYDIPEQATRRQILWMVNGGYWIASTQVHPLYRHATVWKGDQLAHNPTPGWKLNADVLGELKLATLFGAIDPAKIAKKLVPLPTTPL